MQRQRAASATYKTIMLSAAAQPTAHGSEPSINSDDELKYTKDLMEDRIGGIACLFVVVWTAARQFAYLALPRLLDSPGLCHTDR